VLAGDLLLAVVDEGGGGSGASGGVGDEELLQLVAGDRHEADDLAVVHGDRGALDPLGQAAAEVVEGAELHQLFRYVADVTVPPRVVPDVGEDIEVVGGGGAEVDDPTVERLE
jgi:hypothetical protein